jgi:hypothetical protein
MKRLLDDLAARFDLEQRVRGLRLGELIERADVDLDDSPLRDWGTPGPPDDVASVSRGLVDLHYVPHLIIDSLRDLGRVDELVNELNDALSRCVRPGGRTLFATGFFMTLAAGGAAEFCSAGHPPALLTGPDREQRELESNSRPIGLFRDQSYVAEETRIEPGQTMFFYTDGLIELTTRAGEPFGLRRLREFLRSAQPEPKALTQSLYREIARDHDMARLDDDVTFVAAQMREG